MNPDYVPVDTALLVSMEYRLRWLQWVKTKDAPHRNEPEPISLVPDREASEYVALPVDEMATFLGWPSTN